MKATPKLNASPHPRSGPPWTAALALTAGVGVLHLWLLSASTTSMTVWPAAPGQAPLTLQTRTISAAEAGQATVSGPGKQAAAPAAPKPVAPTVHQDLQPPSSPVAQLSLPPAAEPAPDSSALAQAAAPAAATDTGDAAPASPASTAPEAGPSDAAAGKDPVAAETASPAVQTGSPTGTPAPAGPVMAVTVPDSVRLHYQVSGRARGFEFSASAELDWQHDGQRYQSRLMLSAFPLPSRVQTSVGEIDTQGLSPRRFSDKTRSEVAIHFQPDKGRIVYSNNAPQAAWAAGIQDRLSVVLQLSALLAGDPDRFAPGKRISIATAGSREIENWEFTVVGRQSLQLPLGEQAAVQMRRDPRHLYDQTIDLWFAPALGYLPVRMVLSQGNGDRLDQQLGRLERP